MHTNGTVMFRLLVVGQFIPMICMTVAAAVPPIVSQLIVANHPIRDEFGHTLQGSDPDASELGLPVVSGDLVQVLLADGGLIFPPDPSGHPHALNSILRSIRIGTGVTISEINSGLFGCILTPRPNNGTKVFVRVFNAPTMEEASFYADSQLFTVSTIEDTIFNADFTSGMQPLDVTDSDGDGLHNSWEKSYGSNPNMIDSDEDDVSDHDETIAGTDPTDAGSVLEIEEIKRANGNIILTWKTAPGRIYHIEWLNLSDTSMVMNVISGDGMLNNIPVSFDLSTNSGFYRLSVRKDSPP